MSNSSPPSISSSPPSIPIEELQEALHKAQCLALAGQYAVAVAHDVNNPLEAATNLAFLLHEDADHPKLVRRYAGLLEEQLSIMAGIVRRTLQYHRSAEVMQAVDLVEVMCAAMRMHEHKVAIKNAQIKTAFPTQAMVKANSGEMLQVLTNLLTNALDSVQPQGTVSIKVWAGEKEAHVLIADNGHGIPAKLMPKIFDPFVTTKEDRGTGLGLAIAKSVLERHHGRIRARSSVRAGRSGTAFRISLPLQNAAESSHASELGS